MRRRNPCDRKVGKFYDRLSVHCSCRFLACSIDPGHLEIPRTGDVNDAILRVRLETPEDTVLSPGSSCLRPLTLTCQSPVDKYL